MLLAIASGLFVLRGPLKATDTTVNMDTPLLMGAAFTWRVGGNPYDPESIAASMGSASSSMASTLQRGPQAFVYSPPFYWLLGPITFLTWPHQRAVWNVLNTAMMLTALVLVSRLAAVPLLSTAGFSLLGIGLISNPGQMCLALGQTGVIGLLCMSIYWCLAAANDAKPQRWRATLAVFAAAGALLIKPQIGRRVSCL